MLAYVFYHWRALQIEQEAYQKHLIVFHRTLAEQKPEGFQYSTILQMDSAPWASGTEEVYEDWYLVENFAAFDVLNEAAINGRRQKPHDDVARLAGGGTGGVYRLRFGQPDFRDIRQALWFSKPAGMNYSELDTTMEPLIQQHGGALWSRQMTLGPALEFCWHTTQKVTLPDLFDKVEIAVKPVR